MGRKISPSSASFPTASPASRRIKKARPPAKTVLIKNARGCFAVCFVFGCGPHHSPPRHGDAAATIVSISFRFFRDLITAAKSGAQVGTIIRSRQAPPKAGDRREAAKPSRGFGVQVRLGDLQQCITLLEIPMDAKAPCWGRGRGARKTDGC